MATACHTLCKKERLRGRNAITHLFEDGRSFFQSPYRVVWAKIPTAEPHASCFAISVPKRRFKRAVKRNLMKRRTREVFRTNKQLLNNVVAGGEQIQLMLVYSDSRLLPTTELDIAMKKILQRITRQYAESN